MCQVFCNGSLGENLVDGTAKVGEVFAKQGFEGLLRLRTELRLDVAIGKFNAQVTGFCQDANSPSKIRSLADKCKNNRSFFGQIKINKYLNVAHSMSDAVGQVVPMTIQLRILFIYRSLPVSFLGIKTQAVIGRGDYRLMSDCPEPLLLL